MSGEIKLGLSNEEYHSGEGVSNSQLKTLLDKSPAHLRYGVRKESPAMARGTLVHTAVLEPMAFAERYVVKPEGFDGRTKEGKAWVAANAGKVAVGADDATDAINIGRMLRNSHELGGLFAANPVAEASVYWTDELTKELCRCRPDLWVQGSVIVDLKTIESAAGDNCRKNIENFGYAQQAAWYSDGVGQATGTMHAFLFVFVEPTAPYGYKLIELDGEYLDIGRKQYRRALDIYAECKRRDIWPGYPSAIQRVDPSPWFRKAFEATQIPQE